MDPFPDLPQSETCRFESPSLRASARALFRRAADDGVPVMVVRMGDRDAVLPLRGLQRQLGIRDDSADGIMLARIEEALDFVRELRIGDALPAEISTGEASWQPAAVHLHIAAHQARQRLIQWLRMAKVPGAERLEDKDFDRHISKSANDTRLNAMFQLVASQLLLPDAHSAMSLMEELIAEQACIEALRDWLLVPLRRMARKLDIISQNRHGAGSNMEMLTLIRRLCRVALERIGGRFSAIDEATTDIMTMLRGWEAQRMLLRSSRDWLYRSYRAFDPILREWEGAPPIIDDDFWNRLGRTYRFLAPRFMAVQEWKPVEGPGRRRKVSGPRMEW